MTPRQDVLSLNHNDVAAFPFIIKAEIFERKGKLDSLKFETLGALFTAVRTELTVGGWFLKEKLPTFRHMTLIANSLYFT
jgi:hypothetical protein